LEVDPSVLEPKSDDEITVFSNFDEAEFVVDMVEKEEPKGDLEVVNRPNGEVWKEAVDREMDSLERAGTWDMVDKIEGGKEVGSKWVFKVKRLAGTSINKFKAQLVGHSLTQYPGIDFDETSTTLVRFDSLRLILAITVVQNWRPQQVNVKSTFLHCDLE
jgi:hypothetical protein